ncbi:MAG: guanylate kinase [Candidatus Tectomicrobia bacterium]|nr:guanylate kinase [Candidatus Tectomicrobia bacterium]
MKREGLLFVVSAPSGTGKTSLCNRAASEMKHLTRSVSYTTRPPRHYETNGIDYHFISQEEFETRRREGEFLEWAEVYGSLYGTSWHDLQSVVQSGRDAILAIDIQGAMRVKELAKEVAMIFILPPSLKDLEERMKGRGDDAQGEIKRRLEEAPGEIVRAKEYDYLIINRQFDQAVDQLKAIIKAERCRTSRLLQRLN